MKRFTDTAKWEKSWFRKMPPRLKCFWSYLCDRCDCAGVWEPDYDLASLYIGEPVSETDLHSFNADEPRVRLLPNGKVLLERFLEFQYGVLNPSCRPHQKVIGQLARHGIHTLLDRVSDTLQEEEEDKDQEEDKEEEKDSERARARDPDLAFGARCILRHLNERAGRNFREVPAHVEFISARLREHGVTIEEMKRMIDRQVALWKGTDMEKYLRPETLFNKTKFASYFDDRNQPLPTPSGPPRQKSLLEKETEAAFEAARRLERR